MLTRCIHWNILLLLALITSCKVNSEAKAPCGVSALKATVQKAIDVDLTSPSGQAAGGYIRVEYNQKLIEGHNRIREWVKPNVFDPDFVELTDYFDSPISKDIYKEHFCTAMFDFEELSEGKYQVYIWTSRHCLTFPFIEATEIYVSTVHGYIPIPIETEFKTANDALGNFLDKDLDAFVSFFLINKSSQFRNTVNSAMIASYLFPQVHISDDLENHQKQIEAFRRPLCNSYQQNIQIKTFDTEKLCFSAKDMVLVSGNFSIGDLPSDKKFAVTESIKQSINFRRKFAKGTDNLVPVFTEWRNIIETTTLASYFEKLRAVYWYLVSECTDGINIDPHLLCKNEDAKTLIEAEYVRVENEMKIRLARLKIPDQVLIGATPYSRFDNNGAILSYLDIVDHHLRPAWQTLVQDIADHSLLHIMTNVKTENGNDLAFRSIPYANIINFNNYPPFITPLGFAHLLPKGGIKFVSSDSGSIVTLGGYYPIVALSSVNDDEVTGGYSKKDIPTYEAKPSDLTKPQPGSSDTAQQVSTDTRDPEDRHSAGSSEASIYDDENLEKGDRGSAESIRQPVTAKEPACG